MAETQLDPFDNINTPIGGVMPDQLSTVWPQIQDLLTAVVTPNTGCSLESVREDLQKGIAQLWVIGDFQAIAITYIQQRPVHKVLWIQYLAGHGRDEWLDDWRIIAEEYAQYNGCAAVEFSGRHGWLKVHKQEYPDYKPILTTFRKDL